VRTSEVEITLTSLFIVGFKILYKPSHHIDDDFTGYGALEFFAWLPTFRRNSFREIQNHISTNIHGYAIRSVNKMPLTRTWAVCTQQSCTK